MKTAAAGLAAGPFVLRARGAGVNNKVQHASIGVGGMGGADLKRISAHKKVEIVAVCDVDTRRMAFAKKQFPNARRYQDWRELLDKEGDKVDSVNVSVPDHMHAPITLKALEKGRAVYCQKPLTHDIAESRNVLAAAEKARVVTQMGIQLSSSIGTRMTVEMLRSGVIGKVKEVHMWSNKPASRYRPRGPRPAKEDPVPKEVNWDWWCGVAPKRPYVRDTYHPTWWRGWQDFGCGWLGDMGCHIIDMPCCALKLGMPIGVQAEVEQAWIDNAARRAEVFPQWEIVRYKFTGTDMTAGKTIDVVWSDGGKYPPDELQKRLEGGRFPKQGTIMIGEEGVLMMPHGGGPQLFPKEKFRTANRPKLKSWDHYHQFIDAVIDNSVGKTQATFEYAAILTEVIRLGTVALRCPGKSLVWDPKAMKVTNVEEANKLVQREYRTGW
jgi:predicted dehydrogenase